MYGATFGSAFSAGAGGAGGPTPIFAVGAVTFPSPYLARANGAAQLPRPQLWSQRGVSAAAVGSAPALRAVGATGAISHTTLPSVRSTAAAVVTARGVAALSAPRLRLTASGHGAVVAPGAAAAFGAVRAVAYCGATGRVLLGALTARAVGTAAVLAEAVAAIPSVRTVGHATVGVSARLVGTLPVFRVGVSGRLGALAPSFAAAGAALPVFIGAREAYFVNLNHRPDEEKPVDEVTHATLPFITVLRVGADYYGVAPDGLYILGAQDDAGVPVQWRVRTGYVGDPTMLKTLESAVVGGRLGAATTMTLLCGEAGSAVYSYSNPRGSSAQNYRQVFGKGVRQRYLALELSGSGPMTMDSLSLDLVELTRRI